MLTSYDKVLAPLLVFVIGWLNQRFGWQFSTDPATVQGVIGALMLIATFITPSKATTAQAAQAVATEKQGQTPPAVAVAAAAIVKAQS